MKKITLLIAFLCSLSAFSTRYLVQGTTGTNIWRTAGAGEVNVTTSDFRTWYYATFSGGYIYNAADEIWLAGGTYTLSYSFGTRKVSVYGGFAGTETTIADRSKVSGGKAWEFSTPTILDGKLASPQGFSSQGIATTPNTYIDGVTITKCQITNVTASVYGVGAYISQGCVMQNCIVSNNTYNNTAATNSFDCSGGGIYLAGGQVLSSYILGNQLIKGNGRNTYGGGIAFAYVSEIALNTVSGCRIESNTCTQFGGGMEVIIGNGGTIENCIFKNNSTAGLGGGLGATNTNGTSTLSIKSCQFIENSSSAGGGGADLNLIATTPGTTTIEGCSFIGNTGYNVGGLSCMAGRYLIKSSDFRNNKNTDAANGAFDASALYSNVANTTVQNCVFANNSSVTNTNKNHTVKLVQGGNFYNCTVANNYDPGSSAYTFTFNASVGTIKNCVFWGNTNTLNFSGVGNNGISNYNATTSDKNTNGSAGGGSTGNIATLTASNTFVSPTTFTGVSTDAATKAAVAAADWSLKSGCPSINTGLDLSGSGVTKDLLGNARPTGASAVDMGAYEAAAPSAPTITAITAGNAQLSVAFTAGAAGSSAITNFKYSTDGGSNFTACSPTQTTSPIVITGLGNGTTYNVQIKAVSAYSDGTATASTSATPKGNQTITFAAPTKNYGDTDFAPATASSSLTVTYVSSNTALATIVSGQIHIVGVGSSTITASQVGNAAYNAAADVAQTLTVNNPISLTVSTPAATNKPYDGNNTAAITGTLSGVINSDDVSMIGAGTFASTGVGTGIAVTSTSTLSGTKTGNYTLTQPINLTANITAIVTPVTSSGNLGNAATLAGTDITVSNDAELSVNNTTTVRSITVAPGAKLTVDNGVVLTVNSIVLHNTAGGTASFVDNRVADAPSAIAGTVEQAITETNRNWYVAIPLTGQTAAGITLTDAKIVQRNEAQSRWDDLLSGASLIPGIGYIAVASASTGTTNWIMNGNFNSGKVEVGLTHSGASSVGYNLVGNPYPSYLNWEQVMNLNSTNATLVQPTIWYRTATYNNGLSKFDYTFNTYNSAGRVATPTSTTGYIPPLQAFWVKANTAGTLTFTNAMRSHGNGSSNKLKTPQQNTQPIVRLLVSNSSNATDETVLYFNENAQNTFDKYDSPKRSNNSATIPEIYTVVGNEQLVINGLNDIVSTHDIALGFKTGETNTFNIKASEISNFEQGTQVYIKDILTNSEYELTIGSSYTFSSDVTNTTDRFRVLFRSPSIISDFPSNVADNLNVSVYKNANNQITVNCKDFSNNAQISVYNAVGQKLVEKQPKSTVTVIDSQLDAGIYMVTVVNEGKIKTFKLILN